MACKKHETNDFRAILILVLTILPLVASTNINCNGKPFHCVNSTYFMICVDIGGGYSSTIDNFIIPCPPTTVCIQNNRFECEFPPTPPSTPILEILHLSTKSIEKGSKATREQNVVTTDLFNQTTDAPIYDNINSVNPMTLNNETSTMVYGQQTNVTLTSNIQAINNVPAKTNTTDRSIDTLTITSAANMTIYPNSDNIQLIEGNTTKENQTVAGAVNKFTIVETHISGKESNTANTKNIPIDRIKPEITTEPAAFVIDIQKTNTNGSDNITTTMTPTSAYSQNFSNTVQDAATPSLYTNTVKELLTTNMVQLPIFSISLPKATTEAAMSSSYTQTNKNWKEIVTKVQESSTINNLNTVIPTSPVTESKLISPQSSNLSIVGMGLISTQSELTSSPVITESPMLSVSTVAEYYPTSVISEIKVSSGNNTTTSTTLSIINGTAETLHNNVASKTTQSPAKPPKLNAATEGSSYSHHTTNNIVGGDIIDITTKYISSMPPSGQNFSNTLHKTATTISNTNTFNASLTNVMVTEANTQIGNGYTNSHIKKDWKGVDTTSLGSPIFNISNTVNPTSLVTEPIPTTQQLSTSSVVDIELVSTQNKLTISSVSTDFLKLSVSTVAENNSASVNSIVDTNSTNNKTKSKISSTTINSIAEKLHNNDSLTTNQVPTEQPKLNVRTEGSLSSHHINVTHSTIGGHLNDITTETISSVPIGSQNKSYILKETSTTVYNTNTFSGPLTTNMVPVTITDKTNRSSDSHIKAIESTTQGSPTLNITNTVKPPSLVTEPSLTVMQSSASSIADIGSVYTQNMPTFPVTTDPTMLSVNTVAENNPTSVNIEIYKSSTNNIFASNTPPSTSDSTSKKIHNNVISKSTEASTKQSVLNVGTEGSLSSHHVTHNTIGGNTIDITTEYLSSIPVNGHNISNMLDKTVTMTFNTNTSHGSLTTDNVTEAIVDIANRSTDSHINNDWKGFRTTIQESPTLNISNTVESTSPVTKLILTGNPRLSTSPAVDTGFVSEQSKLVTSPVSTDSPMLSMTIVSEMYPASTKSDISASGNINTVANKTITATIDVSAITLTNYNISKTTQAGEITIRPKQTNIGTEKGWIPHTTDTIGGYTVNATTEIIPTIPIDGLIVSSTLQNMASTSTYSNASNETNNKNLVAVPTTDKAYRSSDTLGTQGWDATVPMIQERSTFNITDAVIPTSSVTQLIMTGYTQSSTSTVGGMGLISEQSELTISPVTTDSSILSVNTVAEKYSNSKSLDRGTNVTENTNFSEPSIASNLIGNKLNNNTIANTTQAYTTLPNIGTETSLSSFNTSDNIIGNSTNYIDTKNITTIPVDGRDISNVVQDTVTTSFYANTFNAPLSTNTVAEVYNNTTNRSTDIPINQHGKSLLQESSTFNISDYIKTSSPVTELILSNNSVTLAVKSMDQSQGTTSPASIGTIILSVSTITEYPTSLHFDNTENATKNTNTSNIPLATLDVNGAKLNNKNIFKPTEATTQQPEPNGRTANSLQTNNTTDISMRGNTTHGQNFSNKLQDTATPSSYSNTFLVPNTTKMTPVEIVDIVNRSIDTQITQNWDIVITTIYDNSPFNSSKTVNPTSPVTVVGPAGNPQSSTSTIPINTPVNIDTTTLSMTTVTENYPTSAHFDMSANVTNNTDISGTSSTVSGVTNGNIKNNNIFKTTQTHHINPEVNTEISLSPFNTGSADTININSGNILKAPAGGQNGSINILPDIKTTSLYSNKFNELHTTRTVVEGVTNTENRSTHTIADQNLDTVLTTIPDSSTVNSSDIIQTASPTTVVIMTGDRLSSTPAVVRNYFNTTSPITLPMSTITEKYSSSINFDMINNTVKENSTSYSIVEKSNTTSEATQPYRKVPDAGTESGLTSYTSRNIDNNIWQLKNSTTQGIKHVTNTLLNYESTSMGSEISITTPTTFIDGSFTKQSISSSTQNHTENMITNTGSNTINEMTTPINPRIQELNASTGYPIESNSSLHFLENVISKQTNNARTTELDNKNNATISKNNNINTFNTGSTLRKIDIITTTPSITNPLQNLLFNKMSNNHEYSSSTLKTGSSLTTEESNNNNGLTTPSTSTNSISAKQELYLPVTSTSQQHTINFETNKKVATSVSDLQYKITQNNEATTIPLTEQTLRTETLSTKHRIIKATTQSINNPSYTGMTDSDGLVSIKHSYLNNTETISTKQANIGNSTNSFSGINSNKSNGMLEQPDTAVNILPTTKYVSNSELPILTTLSSRQTAEVHSSVGNAASTTASTDVTHDLSDQNRNNSNDTSNGNNYMNSIHGISNQEKNTLENKSNRTEENNRIQIENQAVNHEHTSKQMPNSVHKVNALAPSNPQYVNVDGGSTHIAGSFDCRHHRRGRYADNDDCRKFYICIGNHQLILGTCPVNTVFSEINKQCTKNLSHCIRNNQFQCTTEGRFSDYLNDSIYYICLRNGAHGFVRFQLQCQNGYYLNKTAVRCTRNNDETSESKSVDSDSSKRNSDQNITEPKSQESEESVRNYRSFTCEKEGKFADSNDCRRYYVCSKRNQSGFRRKMKICDSDEVFHKDKKKCVVAESNEC